MRLWSSQVYDSRSQLASLSGYEATRSTFARRCAADPWVALYSWPLLSTGAAQTVDMTDDDFFATYTNDITQYPYTYTSWLYDVAGAVGGIAGGGT